VRHRLRPDVHYYVVNQSQTPCVSILTQIPEHAPDPAAMVEAYALEAARRRTGQTTLAAFLPSVDPSATLARVTEARARANARKAQKKAARDAPSTSTSSSLAKWFGA
jgi:hypothetical protein